MSINSRFRVNSPKVVHETIDGEVVIIHLDTGCYYSLDGVGAIIWNWLDNGVSLGEAAKRLGQSYPNNDSQVPDTVTRLAAELQTEALIVPRDEQSSAPANPPEPVSPLPVAFQIPVLHKHTDMQDLLLLDPIHEVDETGWPSIKQTPAA
jgi:Coenzyme PQQ synthesis protein D (PqqD)